MGVITGIGRQNPLIRILCVRNPCFFVYVPDLNEHFAILGMQPFH